MNWRSDYIIQDPTIMANIVPFLPAIPDLLDIVSFDDFFGTAKRKFPIYYRDGYYHQESEPAIFLYRINRQNRSHTGIIACAHVEDYLNGHIKKHEHTLASKELKMRTLFEERNGVIKPILLTYPNVLEIDALINRLTTVTQPSFKIPYQDDEHLFWLIQNPKHIQLFQTLFAQQISDCYICDGHHRTTTAAKLYHEKQSDDPQNPYHYIMAAYFAASEIVIHEYNRVLLNLKGLSVSTFLEKLSQYYHLEQKSIAFRPIGRHHMGCYIDKQWYSLSLREAYRPNPATTAVSECLDVHLFNEYVLKDILGIEDVRMETDVRYLEGTKGPAALERKVDEGKAVAAFNLYPVAIEDLISISDVQGTLPPKSTFVEPRMRNGFIAQLYE